MTIPTEVSLCQAKRMKACSSPSTVLLFRYLKPGSGPEESEEGGQEGFWLGGPSWWFVSGRFCRWREL